MRIIPLPSHVGKSQNSHFVLPREQSQCGRYSLDGGCGRDAGGRDGGTSDGWTDGQREPCSPRSTRDPGGHVCSCPEHTPCAGGLGLPLPRVMPVGRGGLRFPCAVKRHRWHSDLLTPCSAQGLPRGKALQLCGPSPAKHMQVVVGPPLEGLAQCLAADWARSWGPPSHLPELLSRERGRVGSPGAPPRKPLGLTPSEGCPAGTATDLTATRLPRARAVWLRFRARLCSSADAAVAPAATFRPVSAWGRVRACARARAFRGSACCC